MNSNSENSSTAGADTGLTVSRRGKWIGGVIAVAVVGGLGGLAWFFTQPPSAQPGQAAAGPASAASAPGGPAGQGGPGGGAGGGAGGRRGPPASTVGVGTAERANLPVTLDALGTVTPQASVRIKPQVSGVLTQVLFKEGELVKSGQLLATLDDRQFALSLQQSLAQSQRDQAQLDNARVVLGRYTTLSAQDSIARQDVEAQSALVKQLEGTVAINKALVGTAKLNLSYTRITAPIAGKVGLRAVDVGNTVNPSDANGIGLITQISPIDVVFSVPQDRVTELLPASADAMKVTAFDKTRAVALETGVFASLDNQIDTTTGTVKAKARFANSTQALFPNQFVNVRLQLKTIENAVLIPVAALRQGSSGDFVYVLNLAERKVAVRPVVRGQAGIDKILIVSGLAAGEQVITEGADRLKDGARVSLAGDAPRGAGRPASGASGAASAGPSAGSDKPPESKAATPPATPQGLAPAKPDAKAEVKAEVKAEAKAEAKADAKPKAPEPSSAPSGAAPEAAAPGARVMSEEQRARWNAMTPEQREAFKNMTPEQREARRAERRRAEQSTPQKAEQ